MVTDPAGASCSVVAASTTERLANKTLRNAGRRGEVAQNSGIDLPRSTPYSLYQSMCYLSLKRGLITRRSQVRILPPLPNYTIDTATTASAAFEQHLLESSPSSRTNRTTNLRGDRSAQPAKFGSSTVRWCELRGRTCSPDVPPPLLQRPPGRADRIDSRSSIAAGRSARAQNPTS